MLEMKGVGPSGSRYRSFARSEGVKNRDTLSSFVLVLFAFSVCYLSKGLSLWSPEGPGAGFFPFLAGITLGLFGLFLFVQSLFQPKKINEVREPILKIKLLIYIGSILVYPVVFGVLGFFFATFLFLLAICKGGEKASWRSSLIISGLTTIGCFFIFYYLLEVPFPVGFLKVPTLFR
jgi:putative tricarboxylic transport membrane protein